MKGTYQQMKGIQKKINEWQGKKDRHPFTCGKESRHAPLKGQLDQRDAEWELRLVCKECGWEQDVPFVLTGGLMDERRAAPMQPEKNKKSRSDASE